MKPRKRIKWTWDNHATHGYNVLANFESTLINLGIIEDYSDIEDSELFDEKWSLDLGDMENAKQTYKKNFCRTVGRED